MLPEHSEINESLCGNDCYTSASETLGDLQYLARFGVGHRRVRAYRSMAFARPKFETRRRQHFQKMKIAGGFALKYAQQVSGGG